MTRLIDADELQEKLKPHKDSMEETSLQTWKQIWGDECKYIDEAPTIDPVMHGHWVDRNDELFIRERTREYVHITTEVCSNCKELIIHAWTFGYVEYKYCPKCGAKMDGGKDNEEGI